MQITNYNKYFKRTKEHAMKLQKYIKYIRYHDYILVRIHN